MRLRLACLLLCSLASPALADTPDASDLLRRVDQRPWSARVIAVYDEVTGSSRSFLNGTLVEDAPAEAAAFGVGPDFLWGHRARSLERGPATLADAQATGAILAEPRTAGLLAVGVGAAIALRHRRRFSAGKATASNRSAAGSDATGSPMGSVTT